MRFTAVLIVIVCILAYASGSDAFAAPPKVLEELTGKAITAVDGDSISVQVKETAIVVRLEGLDAPEPSQAYGKEAKTALNKLVAGKTVTIKKTGADKFNRTLGIVLIGDVDVSATMLEQGHAWHFKKYNDEERLAKLEAAARSAQRGLWADEKAIAPWDYRAQKKITEVPDQIESVLEPGAQPKMIAEAGAGEGPAWHPELGLLTSGGGHTYRRNRDGKQTIYREKTGSNGLLFDREGRLIMCQADARRVCRLDKDGNLKVLAERYDGKRFNQPNDLTIDTRGRIYFSDPCYGDRSQMEMTDAKGRKIEGVYRIDPDGKVSRIISELDRPNGLVITPDDKYLYVADNNNSQGGARKLWRFELQEDGTVDPKTQTLVYDWKLTRGPDGMKLDAAGRLFVAAGLNKPNPPHETQDQPTAGIYVFSPQGKLLQLIPIGRDETTNCAFGDDDLKTLYVTAGGTLWSMRVRTPGKPAWPKAK
jgi:gluconolactonase